MRILIFMASPHESSNTSVMVREFVSAFNKDDYKVVNVYQEHILPCLDCGFCRNSPGICALHDDMENIYKEISISDAIILASPMYFSSYPGPMKNIIDRCQAYWNIADKTKEFSDNYRKKGILLLNAGAKWDNMFIHMESMGRYFFKTIGAKLTDSVYAPLTDEIPVSNNYEIINQLRMLSQKICNCLKGNI